MGENAMLLPSVPTVGHLNREVGEGHPRLTSTARLGMRNGKLEGLKSALYLPASTRLRARSCSWATTTPCKVTGLRKNGRKAVWRKRAWGH